MAAEGCCSIACCLQLPVLGWIAKRCFGAATRGGTACSAGLTTAETLSVVAIRTPATGNVVVASQTLVGGSRNSARAFEAENYLHPNPHYRPHSSAGGIEPPHRHHYRMGRQVCTISPQPEPNRALPMPPNPVALHPVVLHDENGELL